MKKTPGRTTMWIQNLETKPCQHKSPDLQRAPSNPLHIRKNGQKKGVVCPKNHFFQKFQNSSRTTDVMVPKNQKYQLKSKIANFWYFTKMVITQGQNDPES